MSAGIRRVLCILAHQDDEWFVGHYLLELQKRGAVIDVVYLTNGEGHGNNQYERNRESAAALEKLGIAGDKTHFFGTAYGLPDGSLADNLANASNALANLSNIHFDEIVSCAWEGGHVDHDACFVLAWNLARERKVVLNTFPLYNSRRIWKLFRVGTPTPESQQKLKLPLEFAQKIFFLRLIGSYKSQKKTWAALFPGVLALLFVRNCFWLIPGTEVFELQRPHEGPLLYESLFKKSFGNFETKARAFLRSSNKDF